MEYVYGAMLLHKAQKEINEANLKKVLEAAGVKVDDARVKATVAALSGVNIDDAISKAAVVAPVASASHESSHEKKDVKSPAKEEKKADVDASVGLGSLFG